jgi:hypothetical protein
MSPQNFFRSFGSDARVFRNSDADSPAGERFLESGRLADVVEERGPGQRGAGALQATHHEQGLAEDVSFGLKSPGLRRSAHGLDIRKNPSHQAAAMQQPKPLRRVGRDEEFGQFVSDPFGAYGADSRSHGLNSLPSLGFDSESELGRETDAAEKAQAIFSKAFLRIPNGSKQSFSEIGLPADKIKDAMGNRIIEKTVDRKIAAKGVLPRCRESNRGGASSVPVNPFAPKGGDLDFTAIKSRANDAEGFSHGNRVFEAALHFMGLGGSGHVVISRNAFQEPIADAAARKKSFVALGAKGPNDLQGGGMGRNH